MTTDGAWYLRIGRYLNPRRLWRDERGALAAIVGLAIIPMFAAIGLAIDGGRGYMLKSKLSYAIDAAGLAGGRAFDTDQRESDIMMFFEANFPPGYMDSVLAPGHPIITFNDDENTVTIVAEATIPTRFMGVAGIDELTVSARTLIQRELQGMELVLVMDNTGSMRGGGKIDAMKDAATDLVNILYGSRETVPNFWVSLVPYAANVNIGSGHSDWLVNESSADPDAAWLSADPDSSERYGYHADHYQPTTWKGCVEARTYPNDSNDALPSVEEWYPYLWRTTLRAYENPYWTHAPDDHVVVVRDSTGDPSDPNNIVFEQGDTADPPEVVEYDEDVPASWGRWLNGDNEWDPDGPESALKLDNDYYQNEGTGPNLGCPPALTPLVAEKTTVLDAIADMAPWHRGGTMANLGLAWGWRNLSPQWRGMWPESPPELPLDYTEPSMTKVVILLTDGVNEWYDWPGDRWSIDHEDRYSGIPGSNQYDSNTSTDFRDEWPGADYTAYGRLSEGRLGTTSNGIARSVINDRMLELCSAMKAQDIVLYTITFALSNSTTQQLFRNCATDDDHYFNSPTNTDLQQAFVTIADELSKLRIAE